VDTSPNESLNLRCVPYLGVEKDQMAIFDTRIFDDGEERRRYKYSSALHSFFHNQIGAVLGSSTSVFSNGGEYSGIFHEDLGRFNPK
jgi:hypothetical protein